MTVQTEEATVQAEEEATVQALATTEVLIYYQTFCIDLSMVGQQLF